MNDDEIEKLVASHEQLKEQYIANAYRAALAVVKAVEAEREACAKLVEDEIKRVKPVYSVTAENALKAIRARGEGMALRMEQMKRPAQHRSLTDEQISDLWHQSGQQPFKFARMLVK